MNIQTDDDRIAEVARWLIAEAQLSLAPLDGPADAVLAGAIKRGDRRHIDAAILFFA